MRIATVPFLNVKPLVGLYETQASAGVELVYAPPAALCDKILSGEAEAGFVAATDYWNHRAELVLVEEYGVACRGRVASVLLIHDGPLSRIRRIVADQRSSTSVAVLELLARYHWGLEAVEIVRGDVLEREPADAYLVIGDRALQGGAGRRSIDLGDAWYDFAQLPFVFGVWVARDAKAADTLRARLRDGLEWFEDNADTLCEQYAAQCGLTAVLVREYLMHRILYRLGTEEHQGLLTFGRWLDRLRADQLRPGHPSNTWWNRPRPRAARRVTPEQAVEMFERGELLELGERAHERRCALHNPAEVTYVIDRNVNYTNVCVARCSFCAFYRPVDDAEGYVLATEEMFAKIAELIAAGGTTLLLQGGHNPRLPFSYYTGLCAAIKERFPALQLHGFSPPEFVFFSKLYKRPVAEIIRDLRSAGLDSVPGGGAEILSDRIRVAIAGRKTTAAQWIDVMREVHRAGMTSTATMMFGHIETFAERVEHLERVRRLQDETGGFTAFIPWTYQPGNTALGGSAAGGVDYLRTMAISRLYLDSIPNLQASIVTQGSKMGQIALHFGANDLGGVMLEENVVRATGVYNCVGVAEFRRLIEQAGFQPVQRDTYYNRIDNITAAR